MNRRRDRLFGLLVVVGAVASAAPSPSSARELRFLRNGETVRTLTLAELRRVATPETVTVDDLMYGERKRFTALPLFSNCTYERPCT